MKRMAICAVTAAVMLGVTGCGGNTANNLPEQGQIGVHKVRPVLNPGRLLEPVSDCWPR